MLGCPVAAAAAAVAVAAVAVSFEHTTQRNAWYP